jgi:hypothetical protein
MRCHEQSGDIHLAASVIDLLAVNRDMRRGIQAKSNSVAANFEHRYDNAVTDQDFLANFSR